VSEGCRNCYAEIQAEKANGPGEPYEGLAEMRTDGAHWTGKMMLVEKHLKDPIRWQRPRRIFVNSMSDLFHENAPDEWIDQIFAVMGHSPTHTFQVLTKRADRMHAYLAAPGRPRSIALAAESIGLATFDWATCSWPFKNVWLGVSVENQKAADERVPFLLRTPAIERFISCEPLLGPINLGQATAPRTQGDDHNNWIGNRHLDWVIVGGESGPNFRPMKKEWAESLRQQCAKAKPEAEFFFKQDSDEKPGQRPDLLGGIYQTMPMLAHYDFSEGERGPMTPEKKARAKARAKAKAEEGFDE
jgi:protein gp37